MHSQFDLPLPLGWLHPDIKRNSGSVCNLYNCDTYWYLHSTSLTAWYTCILFAAGMQLQLIMPAGSQRISFLAQKVEKSAVKGMERTVKGSEKDDIFAYAKRALSVKAAEISRSISFRTLALMVAITEKFSLPTLRHGMTKALKKIHGLMMVSNLLIEAKQKT